MKWPQPISFDAPFQEVRLVSPAPAPPAVDLAAERENAAYERGRREGENALREQLILQRNEMGGILNGVLESLRNAIPQLVNQTEAALIQLALESAQKIVAGM